MSPIQHPIIVDPYGFPDKHLRLDDRGRATDELVNGRRPSGPYLSAPLPDDSPNNTIIQDPNEFPQPHKLVNQIRDRVKSWRDGGYTGASRISKTLLEYWRSDNNEQKPFFCQMDAIETLIWLVEVLPKTRGHDREILTQIDKVNKKWNDSICRLAVKMATGTGKTWVMAMIILWQALNKRGRTDVVIITPNRTVKERLAELDPHTSSTLSSRSSRFNLYMALLPPGVAMPPNLRVTVINFQAFRRQSDLVVDGVADKPRGVAKRLLNPYNLLPTNNCDESYKKMLRRVLSLHHGAREIIVINDEAHHCRRLSDATSIEDKTEAQEAALWFGVLVALHKQCRLYRVFDLSATPMYLQKPVNLPTVLFPWIVSDYSLMDAIESGLVKIPTVPIDDNTRRNDIDLPTYRNLYGHLSKQDHVLRHDNMPTAVEDLLTVIHQNYESVNNAYSKSGLIPVMIVVANNVKNANELYKHIAGYSEGKGEDKIYHTGKYKLFSNVSMDESGPVANPPTLLVHSRIDDTDLDKLVDIQREFFLASDGSTKQHQSLHLRKVFNTVGQKGEPGEHIRCIISVSMLSEGWDVRTVTHVFGFRPFGSQLLCEQVAGRALRRTSIRPNKQGKLDPEYARIFGVPFSFMQEKTDVPVPPTERWPVYTMPGRNRHRMSFPNLLSYSINTTSPKFTLDHKKVTPYNATFANTPTWTDVSGSAGESIRLQIQHRRNYVIYGIAMRVFEKLHIRHASSDRVLFASLVQSVREWIRHPKVKCADIGILAHEPHKDVVPDILLKACIQDSVNSSIMPVFMDEHDSSQQRALDTSDVCFETSLKHRYPKNGNAKHSELNAAACHSRSEVTLAKLLDEHKNVVSWIRNYRLGWNIRYLDRSTGRWRCYEPDFVAHVDNGARCGNLIIEFKGVVNDDALTKQQETMQMWLPAVNNSNDPACAGVWEYVMLETSDRITMKEELDKAICKLLGDANS